MFIAFHLSVSFVVDVDLRSDACGTLPWIQFGSHSMVHDFRECFGKSLYGHNLLLTIQDLFLFFHRTSDSPPMKGFNCRLVYSEYVEGSRSSHMLMCVWGNVCSLRVRGLSRRRH